MSIRNFRLCYHFTLAGFSLANDLWFGMLCHWNDACICFQVWHGPIWSGLQSKSSKSDVCSRLENIMFIKPPIMLCYMLERCGNYAAVLTNYVSFLHSKCFSDLPKDIYCRSQNMNNQKHRYTHSNICWHWCPQYIQDASWSAEYISAYDMLSSLLFSLFSSLLILLSSSSLPLRLPLSFLFFFLFPSLPFPLLFTSSPCSLPSTSHY